MRQPSTSRRSPASAVSFLERWRSSWLRLASLTVASLTVASLTVASLTVVACGGGYHYAAAPSAEAAPQQEAAPPPESLSTVTTTAEAYGYEFDDDPLQAGGGGGKGYHGSAAPSQAGIPGVGRNAQAPVQPGGAKGDALTSAGKPGKDDTAPLIVYKGYLRLQVRRVLESVDAITAAAEARGGYVESLTKDSIVVRVPAKDFDQVMTEFALLGEVLDRRIQAADVTEQFTDLGARLSVAREARARLLALLEATKDPAQRLQIVAEVKRLTEQIEATESTLHALQNLVDFYTVSIDLVALVPDSRMASFSSPFEWVNGLSPLRTTLTEGSGDFEWKLPPAFVLFEKADEFAAQSADTAMLRAARVDNEPLGDATFWANAVGFEFDGRGEKREKHGVRGGVSFQVFVNDDLKPRYYLVGVSVKGDDLFVIEAFFPNLESYQRHAESVIASFDSFRAD